ncbi:MAG: hypothetical protein ACI97A_004167 [Planctomycetota bacterium]|jgi:hypothetical protein
MYKLMLIAFAILQMSGIGQAQFVTTYYYEDDVRLYSQGSVVSAAGDVNADGIPDIAVGSPGNPFLATANTVTRFGRVQIFSGADGSLLHDLMGDLASDGFGSSVSPAGDVNNDGFDDLIVGIRRDDTAGQSAGSVRVYSGLDGSILYAYFGSAPSRHAGLAVVGLGDINGDNYADFAFSESKLFGVTVPDGFVYCHSGIDGSLIRIIVGPSASAIANAQDVNGDGIDDLIVGDPRIGITVIGSGPGQAQVFSGSDGTLIHTFQGLGSFDSTGVSVDGVGDINGDSFADLIVGEPGSVFSAGSEASGRVRVFSGFDGAVLFSISENLNDVTFATEVAGLGDVSQDSIPDFAVFYNDLLDPHVRVYSGADGSVIGKLPGHVSVFVREMSVANVGDVDNNGSNEIAVGSFATLGFASLVGTEGEVRVYLSGVELVTEFFSVSGSPASLDLQWQAANNQPNNVLGRLIATGATPGALGLILASLAPADIPVFGFDLLTAVDTTNLVVTATLGANISGEFIATISRRIPALAGSNMYVQFIETHPTVQASNGLKFLVIP